MNISLNNYGKPTFGAQLSREKKIVYNKYIDDYKTVESTRKDMIDSYNAQIKRLQDQKNLALELDTFMYSDETKKLVKQLPENGTVEVAANFYHKPECMDDDEVYPGDLLLMYEDEDPDKRIENDAFFVKSKNGKIDKEGIKGWLNDLCEYFNKK